jgi:hypothetical protein
MAEHILTNSAMAESLGILQFLEWWGAWEAMYSFWMWEKKWKGVWQSGRGLYSPAAIACLPLCWSKQVMSKQFEWKIYVHKARKFHLNFKTVDVLQKDKENEAHWLAMFEHHLMPGTRQCSPFTSVCDHFDNLQLLWPNSKSDRVNISQFFILKPEVLILSTPSTVAELYRTSAEPWDWSIT